MEKKRGVFYSVFFFFVISIIMSGFSYADPYVGGMQLSTTQNGTVTGGLYVDSYIGTNGTANDSSQMAGRAYVVYDFKLPQNASVRNATLYVLVYSGHMQEARNTRVNVTYNNRNLDYQELYTTYTYAANGGNDNTAILGPGHERDPYLMVNDRTVRVTSDYLIWYDVTDITGSSNRVLINTTGSYDGRIKLITLVAAYDLPGSTGYVSYWVNVGHDVDSYYSEEYTGSATFKSAITDPDYAELVVVHASSTDGSYRFNNRRLSGGQIQGDYSGLNRWNVTDLVTPGNNVLIYDRAASFYKIVIATLAVRYTPQVDNRPDLWIRGNIDGPI